MWAADAARIPHCYGCGIGRPSLETSIYLGVALKRQKKKKKKDTGKPFDTSSDKGKETSSEERLKIKAGLPYRARTLTRS